MKFKTMLRDYCTTGKIAKIQTTQNKIKTWKKKQANKQQTNKKIPGAGEDGGRRTGNEKLVIAS